MTEKKFSSLRKRLDQLGYRQPLGVESVPLTEKLFSDLIHTTESLKNVKLELKRYAKDRIINDDNVEPYRHDNAKLVRENNELHLQHIKIKEDGEAKARELKSKCSRLESENADLKFLNSQYIHRVKSLEKESSVKSEKIQALQEDNMDAIIETPGGRKKKLSHRRQRMDIASTVQPSIKITEKIQTNKSDPYFNELMEIADKRIADLQDSVERLEHDAGASERRHKSLKKQIDARDNEIERLNRMFEGGRPVDAILTDTKRESSDRVIAHLNIQVDYLQQLNKDLEKQAKHAALSQEKAEQKLSDLQEKNNELCVELHDLGKVTQNTHTESATQVSQLRKNVVQMENQLDAKQTLVLDLQADNHKIKKERDSIISENEELTMTVDNLRDDITNFSELIKSCEREKKRLQDTNSRLSISEKELIFQLERCRSNKNGSSKRSQSPDRIHSLLKTAEEERDHFKTECQSLQSLLRKKILKNDIDGKEKSMQLSKDQLHMEGLCQMLEEERDFYRREYEMMRNVANSRRNIGSPPTKDSSYGSPTEKSRLRRERDELQTMLASFERQIDEIKSDLSSANNEKSNVQLLYEQATDEIHRLRRQLSRTRPVSPSRKVTSVLDRVEKERDDALDDLRRMRNESQNLEGQIKILSDSQALERSRYDNKIADLEDLVSKLEDERSQLQSRLANYRDMKDNLEGQLKATLGSVRTTRDTVADKEAETSRLRLLLDQSDRLSSDLKAKLKTKVEAIKSKEDEKISANTERDSLKQKKRELDKEVDRLQGIVRSIDSERDKLQNQIDEQTEKLVAYKERLKKKEGSSQELKTNLSQLKEKIEQKEADTASKSLEIRSLSHQVSNLENEVSNASRMKEAVTKENRRLQEDLQMMTQENQSVNQRLQDAVDEQEILKLQVSDYANQISRVEELLSQKDQEKQDLIMQFHSLTNKAELLENNVQQSLGEATMYKSNLMNREQEVDQLASRCLALENEIEHYISANDGYEQQLTLLTKEIDAMKQQLINKDKEKEQLNGDLNAIRDLCVKLDQTREDLTKQLANHSADHNKMQILLQESKEENDGLRRQVFQERDTVSSLETILSSTREKQFYESKSHEETFIEYQKLQNDTQKLERQKDTRDAEAKTLRKSVDNLQDELTHVRKQLISEKYEKERLSQQLRTRPLSSRDKYSAMSANDVIDSGTRFSSDEQNLLVETRESVLNYDRHSPSMIDKITTAPLSPVRPSTSSVLSQLRDQTEGYATDSTTSSRP